MAVHVLIYYSVEGILVVFVAILWALGKALVALFRCLKRLFSVFFNENPVPPSSTTLAVADSNRQAPVDIELGRQLTGQIFKFGPAAADSETGTLSVTTSTVYLVADFREHGVLVLVERSCAICSVEFEHGDRIKRIANCNHIFHKDCVVVDEASDDGVSQSS